jgi:hypothetical protein
MPDATRSSRQDLGRAFGRLVAFPGERRPERPPSNLPLELSSFVGKVKEMAQVGRLLADTGLLSRWRFDSDVTVTHENDCERRRRRLGRELLR